MKAPDVAEEDPLTGEIIGAAIERLVDGVKRVSL